MASVCGSLVENLTSDEKAFAQINSRISLDRAIRIIDLVFSIHANNALTGAGIITLGDLLRTDKELVSKNLAKLDIESSSSVSNVKSS